MLSSTNHTPTLSPAAANSSGPANDAVISVLVVDDDPSNRESLSRRLTRRGYSVATAADGQQALDMIPTRVFDVILLDVTMPGMDGIEVLTEIRRTRPATLLPVVMATARSESEEVVRALALGANDYVTKPLDFSVVEARIGTQATMRRAVARAMDLDRQLRDRNEELESANKKLLRAAERTTRELRAAADVQAAFLPQSPPEVDGVNVAWAFQPCQELAGDSLNVVPFDGRNVGFYILDVTGHGVAAALLAVAATRLLSTLGNADSLLLANDPSGGAPTPATPDLVATQLNERLPWNDAARQFLTLAYVTLDASNGTLRYVSAGHPPALHANRDGVVRVLEGSGLPIGLATEPYELHTMQLQPGDRVYLYTDGVTDAMNDAGECFCVDRLTDAIHRAAGHSVREGVAALMEQIRQWRGSATNRDDASVLAFEYAPG